MRGTIPRSPIQARQGLSAAQVEHQLRAQAFRCYLCEQPLSTPHADHSHRWAEVDGHDPRKGCARCFRALLCMKCNLMIQSEDPELLRRGAAYIEAFDAQREGQRRG